MATHVKKRSDGQVAVDLESKNMPATLCAVLLSALAASLTPWKPHLG